MSTTRTRANGHTFFCSSFLARHLPHFMCSILFVLLVAAACRSCHCTVQLSVLKHNIQTDNETRENWHEAVRNYTEADTGKSFTPARTSDRMEILLTHRRKATVLNELQYLHEFDKKPKVRETRQLPCKLVPSLTKAGEMEKASCVLYLGSRVSSLVATLFYLFGACVPQTLHICICILG